MTVELTDGSRELVHLDWSPTPDGHTRAVRVVLDTRDVPVGWHDLSLHARFVDGTHRRAARLMVPIRTLNGKERPDGRIAPGPGPIRSEASAVRLPDALGLDAGAIGCTLAQTCQHTTFDGAFREYIAHC